MDYLTGIKLATLAMNITSDTQKQPVVRPGQHKPYAKATLRQIEERTQAAALLLFLGLAKTEIHRVFRERYGVEWRQTDRYMARARTW
jgi:hypothetical protein